MKTLSIFAIIISAIAIAISLFTIRHQSVGQADYIAIAATLLTGVVAFAVGYNIYINLKVTKIVAKAAAESIAANIARNEAERIAAPIADRALFYSVGGGNYVSAIIYFEKKEYTQALRFCLVAKINFERGSHPDMIVKCDDFITEINKRINESVT